MLVKIMEKFLEFITNNYLIIDIITVILILAFIGYFVNIKKSKNPVFKINNNSSISSLDMSNEKQNEPMQNHVNNNNINTNNNIGDVK